MDTQEAHDVHDHYEKMIKLLEEYVIRYMIL